MKQGGIDMECCLEKGELIRLDGGKRGLLLNCNAGTVWVTSGNGADYLIPSGKRFEIPARQIVVVEALENAEFCLGEALPSSSMLHRPIMGFAAC
jgi:hypothetical protein